MQRPLFGYCVGQILRVWLAIKLSYMAEQSFLCRNNFLLLEQLFYQIVLGSRQYFKLFNIYRELIYWTNLIFLFLTNLR